MARLGWVEDHEVAGAGEETVAAFEEVRRSRTRVPPVMRTMSLRPGVMVMVARLADAIHFSDGFLDRRLKERIATYASGLIHCNCCPTSHRAFLEAEGEHHEAACALEEADLDFPALADLDSPALADLASPALADLDHRDRALLGLVAIQTLRPSAMTDDDVEAVFKAGWTEGGIVEALLDGAMLKSFNRMAESVGLTAADFVPMATA